MWGYVVVVSALWLCILEARSQQKCFDLIVIKFGIRLLPTGGPRTFVIFELETRPGDRNRFVPIVIRGVKVHGKWMALRPNSEFSRDMSGAHAVRRIIASILVAVLALANIDEHQAGTSLPLEGFQTTIRRPSPDLGVGDRFPSA